MKRFSVAALIVATSVGCEDRDLPWGESDPVPAAPAVSAPATAAPAEPVEPVEEKPPVPLTLLPAQLPAVDRRDAAVRRSLDPGDCPEGTGVQGRAPPAGVEQFCARGDGTRFGPARVWPKDALPSSGGYIPGRNFRPVAAAGYHEGKLHGSAITWRSSGLRQNLRRYNVGVPVGIWASWDEEGNMVSQRNYFEPEAPPPSELMAQTGHRDPSEAWSFGTVYLYTEFFDDGQLSKQRIRLDDEHELVAGSRTWFKSGQPKCQVDQLPDRVAGHVRSACWHDNGKKKEEGALRGGVRHGEWTEWAKNGSVRVHGTYFEGKKTGTWERTNARGKKKVQTYEVPIAQMLDPLPKMWTMVFKAGNTVVVRPDCDGVSRSITLTADHLIVAAGGDSKSHFIETVTRDEDSYTLGLAGRQSIWVLYKGKGTAAIWKRATKKLSDVAGIYVPTSMVAALKVEPAKCGGEKTKKKDR